MTGIFSLICDFLTNVPPFAVVFPDEGGVFLRGGKYKKTVYSGFYFKIPFYDTIAKIPIKEQVIDLPSQSLTAKDGKQKVIELTIRYEITDPYKAIISVQDYDRSLQNLAMGVAGEYISLIPSEDCTYGNIRKEVLDELKIESAEWGLDVLDVKLKTFANHRVFRLLGDIPIE